MNRQELVNTLKDKLKEQLPGFQSQIKLAPESRLNVPDATSLKNAGKSAVLILIYPQNGHLYFPLIKRVSDGSMHSGQIALPGGKKEISDKTLVHTALREAEEEVGIKRQAVEVLKELTPLYIPVSNFLVQPVLAFTEQKPQFIPDRDEVDKIYVVKMKDMLNAEIVDKTFHVRKHEITAPFFILPEIEIWGATAMILSEFIDIVKDVFES